MNAIVISYAHADTGLPMRGVAGLTLVRRAVLDARKAGFDTVSVITRADDNAAVAAEVGSLGRVYSAVSAWNDLPADAHGEEVVIALGDRVWLPELLAQVAAPLAADESARELIGADGPSQMSPGLLRIRRSLLYGDIPSRPTNSIIVDNISPAVTRCGWAYGWAAVRSEHDAKAAETLLLNSLIKPTDGIVSRRINRKISTAITRRLAPHRVRPNQVTFVVLVLGLMSGPLAFAGTYVGFTLGALCYYLAAVIDGVDGELARLKHLGSARGAWFDTVTDDVVGLSWLVGMYAGLARNATHPHWQWIGYIAIICYVGTVLLRYYVLITRIGVGDHQILTAGPGAEAPRTAFQRLVVRVRDVVFRTDFLPAYALITAAVGAVPAFAAPYAVGSVLALINTIGLVHQMLRTPTSTLGPRAMGG